MDKADQQRVLDEHNEVKLKKICEMYMSQIDHLKSLLNEEKLNQDELSSQLAAKAQTINLLTEEKSAALSKASKYLEQVGLLKAKQDHRTWQMQALEARLKETYLAAATTKAHYEELTVSLRQEIELERSLLHKQAADMLAVEKKRVQELEILLAAERSKPSRRQLALTSKSVLTEPALPAPQSPIQRSTSIFPSQTAFLHTSESDIVQNGDGKLAIAEMLPAQAEHERFLAEASLVRPHSAHKGAQQSVHASSRLFVARVDGVNNSARSRGVQRSNSSAALAITQTRGPKKKTWGARS
jgi:hypothetical protein